jgi:hypothetical protein
MRVLKSPTLGNSFDFKENKLKKLLKHYETKRVEKKLSGQELYES